MTTDTPNRIIDATLAIIAEKGSDALRTREILERAGVSNLSAISYYFGSLENLRQQALERYFAGALPLLAGLEQEPDPRQALLSYCQRMAEFILTNPTLERNIVSLVMLNDRGESPGESPFFRILAGVLQSLQRQILRAHPEREPESALFDAIALASATIYPLLLAGYGPGALGLNPLDPAQRDAYFTNLIDRILGPAA